MLSTTKVAKSRLCYKEHTHKGPLAQEVKDKGVTNKKYTTEKLTNDLQLLYNIALGQNVDETVCHPKVLLAVGAVHFTMAVSLIVKTEG